jgi:hypothetical protein
MSANVLSFAPTPFPQEAVVVSNGDHRVALAASRTDRRAQEIERLPFDLSALEEEGVFINVDAVGVTITEDGEVSNALFRFMSRYVFGHTATLDAYLASLARRFGENTTLQ